MRSGRWTVLGRCIFDPAGVLDWRGEIGLQKWIHDLKGAESLPVGEVFGEQGGAAERMAQWVISKNYLKETNAGSIYFHAGHHFYENTDSQIRYIIKKEKVPPKDFLHKESVILFGREILTHYLVRQDPQ